MSRTQRGSRYARIQAAARRRRQALQFELLESRTLLSGSNDLTTLIKSQLDGLSGAGPFSGSFTETGKSYTLGGVTIDSPSITYTDLSDNSGDWSGALSIGATSASLAVGSLASTSISGFSGTYTLSGPDDAGAFAFTAEQFDVGLKNVFTVSAQGVSIAYNPAATGSNSKLSIDVQGASGTIIPFHDATVTLGDLSITDGGFTLADGTLSTGDVEVGGLVEATGPSIVLSNVAEAGGSLTGTIGLHADSFSLFPGQTAFTSTIDGFQASYDISSSASTLGAQGATLKFSDFLQVTATKLSFSDALNDPSQYTLTFDSAVLASPRLSGLSAVLNGFSMNSSGFTLAQADLTGSFRLGSLLQADNVDLAVRNLVYSTSTSGGSLTAEQFQLTSDSVALFPGQTAFTSSITDFKGVYTLSTGALNITAGEANLSVGSILALKASDLEFDYDTSTNSASSYYLKVGTASLSSPQFSGLTGRITDFEFDQSGFSLGRADLSADSLSVGGLLQLDNADLAVSNFNYSTETHALDQGWGIELTAKTIALFPGQSAFHSSVTGFLGSYDSSTDQLTLQAGGAHPGDRFARDDDHHEADLHRPDRRPVELHVDRRQRHDPAP